MHIQRAMHPLRALVPLLLALVLFPAQAEGRLRVRQRGPRAATAAARIRRALAGTGVNSGTLSVYVRRARPRWVVRISFSPPGGRPAVTMALRVRHGRVTAGQAAAFARRARASLGRPAARPRPRPTPEPEPPAPAPAPAPAPTPTPEQAPPPAPAPAPAPEASDDTLGFEVAEPAPAPGKQEPPADRAVAEYTPKGSTGPTPQVKKRRGRMPRNRVVARLGAGVGLAWRRFLLDAETSAMNFESGLFSQISVDGEIYPLQLITRSAIAQLGLRLTYTHSAGLSAELEQLQDNLSTDISRVWAGLVYRLPRFRDPRLPRFDVRMGVTHTGFDIEDTPDQTIDIQDLSLTAFAAGATVAIYFKRWLGIEMGGEYRSVLRARSDFMLPYDTRPGALQGFHAVGGVRGRVFGGLGYRVSVSAERYFGNIPALATEAELKVRDWTVGADAALTYEL